MLKRLVIIIGAAQLAFSLQGLPTLLVENHYGSTVGLRVNNVVEQRIDNGTFVSLGTIDQIHALEIRTTGIGSGFGFAPYSPLHKYLQQINYAYDQHPNKNPVLVISPSPYLLPWKIDLVWQSDETLGSFELSEAYVLFFLGTTGEEKLKGIMAGALGPDYAEKVSDICSTSYQYARKHQGKINLCEYLKRIVVAPKYKVGVGSQGIGPNSPEMEPLIEEIKEAIDMVYRVLLRYQAQGWVHMD